MILALLIGLASATDPLHERLLGPEGTESDPVAEIGAPPPIGWSWSWLVAAGAAAIGLWQLRRTREQLGAKTDDALRVVGRTPLGGQDGMALIEVEGTDGPQRFLVGYGPGTPCVLAALGPTTVAASVPTAASAPTAVFELPEDVDDEDVHETKALMDEILESRESTPPQGRPWTGKNFRGTA